MRRNWLEWAVLVGSVAAIVILVGFLGAQALAGDEPPDIRIEARVEEGRETATGWELPLTVRNEGGLPAAAVVVEATAMVGGAEEIAELIVDLAAPGTATELVVGFTGRPQGEVAFRLVGYEAP